MGRLPLSILLCVLACMHDFFECVSACRVGAACDTLTMQLHILPHTTHTTHSHTLSLTLTN